MADYPGSLPDDLEDEDYAPVRRTPMSNMDFGGAVPVNARPPSDADVVRPSMAAPSLAQPSQTSDYMPVSAPSQPTNLPTSVPAGVMSGAIRAPQLSDYAPAPGQKLDAYGKVRPSFGRRLLAGIAGGLTGLRNPEVGIQTAESIRNAPETEREQELARDTGQYNTASSQGLAEQTEQRLGEKNAEDIKNTESEIKARDNPQAKEGLTPEETTIHDLMTGNNGQPRVDPSTGKPYDYLGAYKAVSQAKQDVKPDTTKPETIEMGDKTYQWDADKKSWNPIGAAKKSTTDEGTWSLEEDSKGNPVLFNSKTSQTRPANGIEKSGTKQKADAATEKELAPVQGAQDYADTYLQNGVFTGPGDEALQEKFFELAKPSTGFRMTQPQINMLANSRSWMGGMEAHVRHATTGTWFSDEQRKQIVNTMKDLAKAKTEAAKPSGGGGTSSAGHSFTYNGKQYSGVPDNVYGKYKGKPGFKEQ